MALLGAPDWILEPCQADLFPSGGRSRSRSWTELIPGVHSPGRKGPGKEQQKHQQDSIAVIAVERIGLRQHLGSSGDERGSRNDQKASQKIEPHHIAHAEDKNPEENKPGDK